MIEVRKLEAKELYFSTPALNNTISKLDQNVIKVTNDLFIAIGLMFAATILVPPLAISYFAISSIAIKVAIVASLSSFPIKSFYNSYTLSKDLEYDLKQLEIYRAENKFDQDAPLGLTRRGIELVDEYIPNHNCWANSLLQGVLNLPVFQRRLKDVVQSPLNQLIYKMLIQVTEEKQKKKDVSDIESQDLRIQLNALNENISVDISEQTDPLEAYNIFENCFSLIPLEREKTIEDPKTGKIRDVKENDFTRSISLSITSSFFQKSTIKSLLNNYLTSSFKEGVIRQEKIRFISPPEDLFFGLNRRKEGGDRDYYYDEKGNLAYRDQGVKDTTEVEITPFLHLFENEHLVKGRASYLLDYFIVHEGELYSGHYISYIRINGKWYECNDDQVRRLSEKEALIQARKSSAVHYSKI